MSCGRDNLKLARCGECPLRSALVAIDAWVPVPSELNESDTIVIGEFARKQDTQFGKPFLGPAGAKIQGVLDTLGIKRSQLAWAHAVACRYPKDDSKSFHAQLRSKNRRRRRDGQTPLPTPEQCCAPRLAADLAPYNNYLAVGPAGLKAVGTAVYDPLTHEARISHNPSLLDKTGVRGAPAFAADGKKLLATLSPQHVIFDAEWDEIFATDIAKAFRYFRGQSTWKEPTITIARSVEQLETFLNSLSGIVVYDVETEACGYFLDGEEVGEPNFDPLRDNLRCVGIGNSDRVIVVPFRTVEEDGPVFWDATGLREVVRLLQNFFRNPNITKAGWNSGYYDRMVIETNFRVTPTPAIDGIILAKLADSTQRQRLGFRASVHTDAPAWKSEHTATEAHTDAELWLYNGRDVAITYVLLSILKRRAQAKNEIRHFKRLTQLQDITVSMHRLGIHVNEDTREAHEKRIHKTVRESTEQLHGLIGFDLNPRSHDQVCEWLFEKEALPISAFTDAGEPSVDADALRALIGNPLCSRDNVKAIKLLLEIRGALQELSHFIGKWRRGGLLVSPSGELHADFNPTGTVGWRWSSSNPNLQNVPSTLRDCFEAGRGFKFVKADYDQLELRLAAAMAQASYYIDMLKTGAIDPHNGSGELVFGSEYWHRDGAPLVNGVLDKRKKGTGAFKKRRELIKRFVYAALYGALPPTILDVLAEATDDDGNFMFIEGDERLTVYDVRALRQRWLRAAPEFPAWWNDCEGRARRDGYIQDPIWGIKRYFPARTLRDSINELINFGVQAGGAAIVHTGMLRMIEKVPFTKDEGLAVQIHDELVFRVREDRAEQVKQWMNEEMQVEALGMTFSAEAKIVDHL